MLEDFKEKVHKFYVGKIEGKIEFPRVWREVSCYFGDKTHCFRKHLA